MCGIQIQGVALFFVSCRQAVGPGMCAIQIQVGAGICGMQKDRDPGMCGSQIQMGVAFVDC